MTVALYTGTWRLAAALLGLFVFGLWEIVKPFRPLVEPRPRHYLKNLFIGAFNSLFLNITVSSFVLAFLYYLEQNRIGLLHWLNLGPAANMAASFLFLDFATYCWHKAYHEVPLMWRLHKVHHSDLDLDVTSASRFHLGEILWSLIFKMGIGLVWGPTVLAMAVHEAGLLLAAQFQHANIGIGEPWETRIKKIIVTPDMHRIHHSDVIRETNSNYSNLFSFWDRLFGTYTPPVNQRGIVIGLKEYPTPQYVTLPKLLLMPFY
ncbi:MAG: sterol desaturase family protein [Elusimicrobia bacterium]|nr:sterol desaturase family protein [Elusimicrobiota bacterium]